MSTTDRFDPSPDADYGKCNDCGINLATEPDAKAHMRTTMEEAQSKGASRSHRVSVLNPGREQRITTEVDCLVDDAIQDAMEQLDRLVDRGDASEAEITAALKWHSDFANSWEEYIQEAAS